MAISQGALGPTEAVDRESSIGEGLGLGQESGSRACSQGPQVKGRLCGPRCAAAATAPLQAVFGCAVPQPLTHHTRVLPPQETHGLFCSTFSLSA